MAEGGNLRDEGQSSNFQFPVSIFTLSAFVFAVRWFADRINAFDPWESGFRLLPSGRDS